MDKRLTDLTKSEIESVEAEELVELLIEDTGGGIFNEALEIAKKTSNREDRTTILNHAFKEMSKKGMVEKALELAKSEISSGRNRVIVLTNIAEGLTEIGETDKAEDVLDDALEVSKDISSRQKKVKALTKIATVLAHSGYVDKARNISDDSLNLAKEIPDDLKRAKSKTISEVAASIAATGQLDKASQIIKDISYTMDKSLPLKEAAITLAKRGRFRKAIETAESVPDGVQKGEALCEIVAFMDDRNKINRALEIARKISNEASRAKALTNVARNLEKNGQHEMIEEILDEALNVAEGISSEPKKVSVLKRIAEVLEASDQNKLSKSVLDKASNIADGISYEIDRAIALAQLSESGPEELLKSTGSINYYDSIVDDLKIVQKKDLFKYSGIENPLKRLVKSNIENDAHLAEKIASFFPKRVEIAEDIENKKEHIEELAERGVSVKEFRYELEEAERLFEGGDLDSCRDKLEYLEDQNIGELTSLAENLQDEIENLQNEIEELSEKGVEIEEIQSKIKESKKLYEDRALEKSNKAIDNAREKMKDIKSNLRPNLEVSFLQSERLEPEVWGVIDLETTNNGEIHAKNVNFDIKGEVKSHGANKIDRIEAGSSEEFEVRLQPLGKGHIPIEVKTRYEGVLEGTEYEEIHQPDIVVGRDLDTEKEKKNEEEMGNSYRTREEIKEKIKQLTDLEEMLDMRDIKTSLKQDEIKKAGDLLRELEEDYQRYQELIEQLRNLDDRKSSLAERLAEGEIDHEAYKSAIDSIDSKKAEFEEDLSRLRDEIIHEDYEKPF